MSPPLFIALRFIGYRKKAMALSLLGVMLGVGFYVCIQAQTQGFERFFVKTVLETSGAIIIDEQVRPRYTAVLDPGQHTVVSVKGQRSAKYVEDILNADEIMRAVREFSNVSACAPILEGNALLRTDFRQEMVTVQGIDLQRHQQTTALRQQIVAGDLADFREKPAGLILGVDLARKLQVQVGQEVILAGPDGAGQTFQVSALFQTGILVIDEKRGYLHLAAARRLMKKPFAVSRIMVKLREPERAPQLAAHLEQLLRHRVRSWQERERGNLGVFRMIRISGAITVSTVILLAGLGIFNILTLMVLDKVREIAVLRSMGYRRRDIRAIFLWQGFLVASAGSLLGCALGAGLTYLVSQIPIEIQGLLTTDRFLVHWSGVDYLVATVIAFAAVLLASYFPSRRAARLAPVAILRGSGQ